MFCNPIVKVQKENIFMEIIDKTYLEDSISPHQLILNSINYLYILESFCLINNIKLYWTTWDISSSIIIQELTNLQDFKLKNYIPFYPKNTVDQPNFFIKSTCSLGHDSEFKDHLCWHAGSDYSIINYSHLIGVVCTKVAGE
jgi:hypothetical protein